MASYLNSLTTDERFLRQAATTEYYHVDALGSTLALTDAAGVVQTRYSYEPYGKSTITGPSANTFTYTGREFDAESGLYFYRARYLDPNTGRFLSEDPIRFRAGDQNLYRYVRNNPTNFRDPSGTIIVPLVNGLIDGALDLGEQLAENGGNTSCLDFGRAGRAALEGALNPFSKLKKLSRVAKKFNSKRRPGGREAAKKMFRDLDTKGKGNRRKQPDTTGKGKQVIGETADGRDLRIRFKRDGSTRVEIGGRKIVFP